MKIPKYSCGTDDISFCLSECSEKTCFRHPSNIIHHDIPHSFSDFRGTKSCMYYHKDSYPCKWYAWYEGVCTNGDCPYCADCCPVRDNQTVCKFMEVEK